MRRIPGFLLLILLMLMVSFAQADGEITAVAQLNAPNMKVGVDPGSAAEKTAQEQLPKAQILYFNDKTSAYLAVAQGKIDAFVYSYDQMHVAIENGVKGVHLLDETLGEPVRVAVGLSPASKISGLKEKINRFIAGIRADGTLADMYKRWVIDGNETMPDIPAGDNLTLELTVGTSGISQPYTYYAGTELTGYDIELARRFAASIGAKLKFKVYDYGAIIAACTAGDVDCVMANLNMTPERAQEIPFSDVLNEEKVGVMVRGEQKTTPAAAGAAGSSQADSGLRLQDYNGKKLGVLVGPIMEGAAKEHFPDSEYFLFNSYPDCMTALLSGKIDAYLSDEPEVKIARMEQPELDYIREPITRNSYCFAFRKDDPASAALCEEFNAFLARCREDGTMQALDDIWFGTDESRKVVDRSDLTGENGKIKVVTTATDMPFSYMKSNQNVGYDIDLVVRFCRDRGYALELGDVDFGGRIPAIVSGKYDFTTDMNVTPERQEQVLFSEPTYYGGIVLAVRSADLPAAGSAPAAENGQTADSSNDKSIAASFYKTFIREDRWRLFAEGIGTTLLITVLSILFGTMLGFLVFMLCRNGNPAANLITRFCLWLVQGMPMVVLLMILYYVVFGSVSISGIAVAVIGFTLTFGSSVVGLLRMGVGAVDGGQYEAAYALGYSNRRTFYRIILPQALPHILPAFRGGVVSLIKATAIVGYIAVQDLTKMGDIVRSRTYEAFFPLIAVTVIYFLLEGLISLLISRIRISINPKRRKPADILKGVTIDDQN